MRHPTSPTLRTRSSTAIVATFGDRARSAPVCSSSTAPYCCHLNGASGLHLFAQGPRVGCATIIALAAGVEAMPRVIRSSFVCRSAGAFKAWTPSASVPAVHLRMGFAPSPPCLQHDILYHIAQPLRRGGFVGRGGRRGQGGGFCKEWDMRPPTLPQTLREATALTPSCRGRSQSNGPAPAPAAARAFGALPGDGAHTHKGDGQGWRAHELLPPARQRLLTYNLAKADQRRLARPTSTRSSKAHFVQTNCCPEYPTDSNRRLAPPSPCPPPSQHPFPPTPCLPRQCHINPTRPTCLTLPTTHQGQRRTPSEVWRPTHLTARHNRRPQCNNAKSSARSNFPRPIPDPAPRPPTPPHTTTLDERPKPRGMPPPHASTLPREPFLYVGEPPAPDFPAHARSRHMDHATAGE